MGSTHRHWCQFGLILLRISPNQKTRKTVLIHNHYGVRLSLKAMVKVSGNLSFGKRCRKQSEICLK